MNFYFWTKPPAADVNTWEELGNPGWNWDAFQKYTLRAEQYVSDPPSNKNRILTHSELHTSVRRPAETLQTHTQCRVPWLQRARQDYSAHDPR